MRGPSIDGIGIGSTTLQSIHLNLVCNYPLPTARRLGEAARYVEGVYKSGVSLVANRRTRVAISRLDNQERLPSCLSSLPREHHEHC